MLAIYTRLSKEDTDSTSIENQLREGKSFAKDNGFNDFRVYNEGEGISGGAKIKDRPKLDSLIKDIVVGQITAVWFRHQNRLERDTETFIIFMGYAESNGIDVFFDDKKFDFSNPIENMTGILLSTFNQYGRKMQSYQTKRTLKDNAREGKVWSIVAYGYKSDNGYLVIDETEAEIVKEIYALSLSGMGARTIANRLNERGVPTRKKKLFRPHTIQSVINNPLYKGERLFGGEVFESPAIVNAKYWQQVNDNLQNNKTHSGKKVEYKYLLKGLLKCFKCGRNYYGRKRANNKDNYYMCSSKRFTDLNCNCRAVNIDVLDRLIWEIAIKQNKLKEHIIEQHNKALKDCSNNELIVKRDRLSKEVSHVNKKLLNAFDFMTNSEDLDDDTKGLFNSKISSLQKAKKVLKNDLEAINKELLLFDEMTKNIDEKLKGFTEIENYKNLTYQSKRESLLRVIHSIKIMDLKENRHTLLLVKPKLEYDVNPMVIIMNYTKDYALVENFETPFLYCITRKGENKYKGAKIVDIMEEAKYLQSKYNTQN